MAGVDVYKNPSADIVEGGVGGTVNLRTRLPFDSAKRIIAYSLDGSYGDLSKKWKPGGSVLYSDRWDTNIGELGFLIDLSDSKLKSRTDTISVDPYNVRTDLVPGKTVYVPGGFGYRSLDFERERKGIDAALQWRPNDQWEATLQFLRSSALQASSEHAVGFNPGSTQRPGRRHDLHLRRRRPLREGHAGRFAGRNQPGLVDDRHPLRRAQLGDLGLLAEPEVQSERQVVVQRRCPVHLRQDQDGRHDRVQRAERRRLAGQPGPHGQPAGHHDEQRHGLHVQSGQLLPAGRDGPPRPQRRQRVATRVDGDYSSTRAAG
jgi:TonB-dependent receptor